MISIIALIWYQSFSWINVIMLKLGVPAPLSLSSSASLVLNTNKGLFLSRIRLKNRIISFFVGLSLESKLLLLYPPRLFPCECWLNACEFCKTVYFSTGIVNFIWFSSLSYLNSSFSLS